MENNIVKPIGEVIASLGVEFGKYTNTQRHFCHIMDGLKPVYRRLLYVYILNGNKNIKTATAIGDCIGKYHPHGDGAISGVATKLVEQGILIGQGNWGTRFLTGEVSSEAAVRYTEARLSPLYSDLFSRLIERVPYVKSEMGYSMPDILPTPFPIALVSSSIGIGYGVNNRLPIFDPISLYEARKHDDFNLLEAPEGLILDKEKSELEELWKYGKGRLHYSHRVEWAKSGDDHGVSISGSTLMHFPNLNKLEEWKNGGYIFRRDETDGSGNRLFYARHNRVRYVNDDELFAECQRASEFSAYFNLNVTDGDSVFLIPLNKWLNVCYDNYISLLQKDKEFNIERINFDIDVYTWLPAITKILIREFEKEEQSEIPVEDLIHEELGVSYEIIKAVMRKTLSTLKRTDTEEILPKLKETLKAFKKQNPERELELVIDKFR